MLFLSACSTTRIVYAQADWFAFRQLDKIFDVRADQRAWVKANLERVHHWHRETQLSRYERSLTELLDRYQRGLTKADLYWLLDEVDAHRLAFFDRVMPDLVRLLTDLDARQVRAYTDYSMHRLDKMGQTIELTPQQRMEDRVEQFVERIQRWTGELDAEQVNLVRAELMHIPDYRPLWIDKSRLRRDALLSLLAEPVKADDARHHLHRWWRDLRTGYSDEALRIRAAMIDGVFDLLVKLDRELNQYQRRMIIQRLQKYLRDVTRLKATQTAQNELQPQRVV